MSDGDRNAKRPAFQHSGFFVLRTPLLPADTLTAWTEGVPIPTDSARQRGTDGLAHDLQLLRERLKRTLERPDVREALFIASPSIVDAIPIWLSNPDTERGRKIERALVKYCSRMSTRCTPFGLFAGVSTGTIGTCTELVLQPSHEYRRHARLDMYYLTEVANALCREPALRRAIRYCPNTSLYRIGDSVRYAAARTSVNRRSYQLVTARLTDYLARVLDRAKGGATLNDLAAVLIDSDSEVTVEDADGFLDELIDAQVLTSMIEPTVTGVEPIHDLAAQLAGMADPYSDVVRTVRASLDELNTRPLGASRDHYQAVATQIEGLTATPARHSAFQVDMAKPSKVATLGSRVVGQLFGAIDVLRCLSSTDADGLAGFREAFAKRYDRRELPLVEVLDEEFGIGLGRAGTEWSPLLGGIAFPTPEQPVRQWTRRDSYLLELLDTLGPTKRELALSADAVGRISGPTPPLPDSIHVVFMIEAESPEAVNDGRMRLHIRSAGGPNGVTMLGRFCHVDRTLHEYVAQHIADEQARRPDVVFAEIVHLPEGRLGNILHRPSLRAHEIIYLGRSGAPVAAHIPISDLFVSVHGDTVQLRSARLNREVIPRLTSAHNYHRGLPIYRFLAMLQAQGRKQTLAFNWGSLETRQWLPRVTVGTTVVSPEIWNLRETELSALASNADIDTLTAFTALRSTRCLPRYFGVVDGDNVLVVDAHNLLSILTFCDLVKGRTSVRLTECVPAPDQLCVSGPEGRFFHEIVLPLRCHSGAGVASSRATSATGPTPTVAPEGRSFTPGSEWLFVKLYGGTATLDDVLAELVAPFVAEVFERHWATCWFFVRYADPDTHLRIRFTGSPQSLWTSVAPRMHAMAQPFVDDGRIWKIQIDTYEREVERYGGPDGVRLSEQVFWADSDAALRIICSPHKDDMDIRWRLTLKGMNDILDDFGFAVAGKREYLTRVVTNMRQSLKAGTATRHSIGSKYRAERPQLEQLLAGITASDNALAAGCEVLRRRSERLRPAVTQLQQLHARGALTKSIASLCDSYLHMHANRMLRGAANQQELILYDFLLRHYTAAVARATTEAMVP